MNVTSKHITGQDIGVKICSLFGVNPSLCSSITININNKDAFFNFEMFCDESAKHDLEAIFDDCAKELK